MTVAFHGPAFSDTRRTRPRWTLLFDLAFGQTSDLYKRLVEQEQKVDQLFAFGGPSVDPTLFTVFARVKDAEGRGLRPRRRSCATFAACARDSSTPPAGRGREVELALRLRPRARQHRDRSRPTIASFAHFERSYDTINTLLPRLARHARATSRRRRSKYFTDKNLVVTTLSQQPLAGGDRQRRRRRWPRTAAAAPRDAAQVRFKIDAEVGAPERDVKFLFTRRLGRRSEGQGRPGALAASMITEAGSQGHAHRRDQQGALSDRRQLRRTRSTRR